MSAGGKTVAPSVAMGHDAIARFTREFLAAVADAPRATDPAQSAAVLRRLVRTNILKFTDMSDAPEKFFLAHRLLVRQTPPAKRTC